MTPDAAGIEAALAAGLAAHDWMRGLAACRCGWEDPTPNWCGEDDRHRAHVAAALLPVVTQAQAEAWDAGFNSDYEGDGWPPNPYRARADETGGAK